MTNSLLTRFLTCRERFRRLVVDGWRPADTRLNDRIEYGQMWHTCEEQLAAGGDMVTVWEALDEYARGLHRKYPMDRDAVALMYAKVRFLFNEYVNHWAAHPDVTAREPLLQEYPFDVPYRLPSGRLVRLRGKWDSVDLIGDRIYLQENKTKSAVDGVKLGRQVTSDLQTMLYLVALDEWRQPLKTTNGRPVTDIDHPLAGTRYNVVRRPAHKSIESAIEKYGVDCRNGRTSEWFGRWRVEVGPEDVARFRRESMDPLLESLLDWWDWVKDATDPFAPRNGVRNAVHWRTPYHYSPISEGGSGDLDALLDTGSTAGLVRADTLFPELAPAKLP